MWRCSVRGQGGVEAVGAGQRALRTLLPYHVMTVMLLIAAVVTGVHCVISRDTRVFRVE